jgi:hypothetical protein
MANRFPLIVDSTSGTIQELASGDNLDMTGSAFANLAAVTTAQVDITAEGDLRLQDAAGGQYVALDAPATVGSSYTLTLPAADGSNGQYLGTNGSGALSFQSITADSGRAYNEWGIKTGNYTAVNKDQLIVNSGSAVTITLPSSPGTGNTVIICNAGAGAVTVGRNSSKINSATEDGTINQSSSAQLVYVDGTIGWFEV